MEGDIDEDGNLEIILVEFIIIWFGDSLVIGFVDFIVFGNVILGIDFNNVVFSGEGIFVVGNMIIFVFGVSEVIVSLDVLGDEVNELNE